MERLLLLMTVKPSRDLNAKLFLCNMEVAPGDQQSVERKANRDRVISLVVLSKA